MDYGYTGIYLFSVLLASFAQILLKTGADRTYENRVREYLNVPVLLGYGMMAVSMLAGMYAYRGVPLSFGPALESMGYVFVAILGRLFLKETLNGRKILGILLIAVGIMTIQAF